MSQKDSDKNEDNQESKEKDFEDLTEEEQKKIIEELRNKDPFIYR